MPFENITPFQLSKNDLDIDITSYDKDSSTCMEFTIIKLIAASAIKDGVNIFIKRKYRIGNQSVKHEAIFSINQEDRDKLTSIMRKLKGKVKIGYRSLSTLDKDIEVGLLKYLKQI